MIPILLLLFAADPYVSEGFLRIPAEVKLGPMSAVETDKDGNIYVLHRGDPPLVKFSAAGTYATGWGTGLFKVAHGLRADRDGNIWTTDNGNHVLRQFSSDGRLLKTLGEEGVAGSDQNHFRSPDDLVFSSLGEIYVADSGNGRIVRLAKDGRYVGEWGKKGKGQSEFGTAHGLAIDSQNRIYVADRGNNRVQVFDLSGKFLAEWAGFGNPFGLLVGDAQLLVSEGDVNKIFHLGLATGKIEQEWGDSDTLQLPHLMSMGRDGKLYVAEVNGKRVQIFRRRP
jgi:sugar lactone lactonase YvrE